MFNTRFGRNIIVGAVIVLASSALPERPSLASTIPPTWEPREVVYANANWAGHVGSSRFLAYDHHGNPGIAFNAHEDDLYYARRAPGLAWATQEIYSGAGLYPSLAFDRYERPRIVHVDQPGSWVKHTYFRGLGGWESSTVASGSPGEFSATSLALDVYGNSAATWRDSSYGNFRFCRDTNGDNGLDAQYEVGVELRMSSLVFDGLNRPMVAGYTANRVYFAMREPGLEWANVEVATVATGDPPESGYPSLAIDPDSNHPAIAYYDELNGNGDGDLMFAQWDGDQWLIDPVDDSLDTAGLYPSLAFDPSDGKPGIAYFNATTMDLMFAWDNGTGWQTQVVDSDGDVGYTPSLAYNDYGTGFPSIAYFNGTDTLFFIEDPIVPEPTTLVLLLTGGLLLGCRRSLTAR